MQLFFKTSCIIKIKDWPALCLDCDLPKPLWFSFAWHFQNKAQLLFYFKTCQTESFFLAISPPDLQSCRISGVSTCVLNLLSAAGDRKLDTLCSRAPCDPSALISCKHKAVSQALPPGPDSRWAFQRCKNVNSQPAKTPPPPVGMATPQWLGALWRYRLGALGGGEQVGTLTTQDVQLRRTIVGRGIKCCMRGSKNEAVGKEWNDVWLKMRQIPTNHIWIQTLTLQLILCLWSS